MADSNQHHLSSSLAWHRGQGVGVGGCLQDMGKVFHDMRGARSVLPGNDNWDRDAILWFESWRLLVASELHPSSAIIWWYYLAASHISTMIFNQVQFWQNTVVVAKFRGSVCRVYILASEKEKNHSWCKIIVPFDCKSLFILISEQFYSLGLVI